MLMMIHTDDDVLWWSHIFIPLFYIWLFLYICHCSIESKSRTMKWVCECVCMAVAVSSQANRRTSGHMQQLSCILRLDVLCMLSFFALQWINYMFNTSINICIWSSLHADSLWLSIYLFLGCMFAQFFPFSKLFLFFSILLQ